MARVEATITRFRSCPVTERNSAWSTTTLRKYINAREPVTPA
jgi:hypothetical protein